MSIAEKLTTIAQNEQRVYDAGYDKGTDVFWSAIQDGGKRTNYENAFYRWGMEYIRPKYFVKPTSRSISMFANSNKLKKVESKYFDLSECSVNQEAGTGGHYAVFQSCTALEEIEDIKMQAGGLYGTYAWCGKLKTIAVVRVVKETKFSSTFSGVYELENVTFEGTIGQNGLNLQSASKLSHDSLMSIINALADYSADTSGTVWKVTIGAENLAKLTQEERKIAENKGWVIS